MVVKPWLVGNASLVRKRGERLVWGEALGVNTRRRGVLVVPGGGFAGMVLVGGEIGTAYLRLLKACRYY